ncbi:hypothetical protein EVA_13977 [gut metagenome]|uniref:Uncharacterized protein n=1 Tax=gut metagenome TaxID=749906 RepID=J9G7Z9_9ZZZZ
MFVTRCASCSPIRLTSISQRMLLTLKTCSNLTVGRLPIRKSSKRKLWLNMLNSASTTSLRCFRPLRLLTWVASTLTFSKIVSTQRRPIPTLVVQLRRLCGTSRRPSYA